MSASFLLLLGVNLLPVAGVLFGGWDAFVLLILYWLETLVIGFWTLPLTVLAPPPTPAAGDEGEARGQPTGPVRAIDRRPGGPVRAVMLSLNAGVFMTVHFLFLWKLFAGPWRDRVTDVPSFVDELVIGTGVWAPLVLLFAARGVLTLLGLFLPDLAARLGIAPEPDGERPLRAFYARIVTLHITLIAGGWAITMLGHQRALVAVVALKILLDMILDPLMKSGRRAGRTGAPAKAR